MFFLAPSVQFTVPVPTRKPRLDFPANVARAGGSRTTFIRILIRPNGAVQSCVVETSSGDSKVDADTCSEIQKRAKFLPAKWPDGSPVYGVIRMAIRWSMNNDDAVRENCPKGNAPDLQVLLDQLPNRFPTIQLSVEVAADERGHPVACAETPILAGMDPRQHFLQLVPIACNRVITDLTINPPRDDFGNPTRSVQTISVLFKRDH